MSRWTRIRPPRTGKHVFSRSPLARLEWGTAGRHRRRVRRGLIAAGILLAAGTGAGIWSAFFRGGGLPVTPPKPKPTCASAGLPGHLGSLAWSVGRKLRVLELDACSDVTVSSSGASGPVAYSADGAWIASGTGVVVPAKGGASERPLGELASWSWAPSGHTLVGVTKSGRVLVGGPGEKPSTILFHGASGAAIDPRSRYVAVARGDKVELYPIEGGPGKVLFSGPSKSTVKVHGWSPDGKWVLFWVLVPGATSGPLDAAPISGAGYHNVFDPVPAFDDFVTWCGDTLVVSGGGGNLVTEGQQLLVSQAPQWQTHNLSRDFRSSWIWPSCAPSGTWIAVTVTPNHTESTPGEGERRIELISIDGRTRVKLSLGAGVFEAPRWSARGHTLLVIQRRRDPRSEGNVELVQIDPKTGKVMKTVTKILPLAATKMPAGHAGWTSVSAWNRG